MAITLHGLDDVLVAVELVCLPVFGVFYNVRWTQRFWPLLLVLALGTWGLTIVGTMFSALTVNLRLRELMLPTLVYLRGACEIYLLLRGRLHDDGGAAMPVPSVSEGRSRWRPW